MKTAPLGVGVMLVCLSMMTGQSWREHRARLCFVRYEDNGIMNIRQSWIHVSDYDVPVIGGQAVCLYVQPGSEELSVTSTIPYDPRSRNTKACRSKPLQLDLVADENRTFSIEPATSNEGSYACGWRIHEMGGSNNTTWEKPKQP